MNKIYNTLILSFCLITFFSLSIVAQAQKPTFIVVPKEKDSTKTDVELKKFDTLHFKYKFIVGDTLIYETMAFDSIVINYGVPLRKTRIETIKIICDSITYRGNYHITYQLMSLKSVENTNENLIERTESPWIGRKIWLEIDSLGKRYSWGVDDSTRFALCPGGAFNPYMFTYLSRDYGYTDKTWLAESTDELPENGVPVSIIEQSTLFKAIGTFDTLNHSCNRIDFIKRGQGSVVLSDKGLTKVTNIITSFGIVDFVKDTNVVAHFFQNLEQKLTLHYADGNTQPGRHYTNIHFVLKEIKKGIPQKNKHKETGKKNSKKKNVKKK